MEVRPVGRCRRPGYPSRDEVLRDPGLLRRNVPPAWRKSARVTAAMSIMLAVGQQTNSGCGCDPAPKVAPLFFHGGGVGSAGCLVVTAPVFLSEEEALKAISEEFESAGISLSRRDVTLDDVLVPRHELTGYDPETFEWIYKTEMFPLKVDLVDLAGRVAVEYVATDDCFNLGAKPGSDTIQKYACREVASGVGTLIRASRKAPKMFYGVFYDPMTSLVEESETVSTANTKTGAGTSDAGRAAKGGSDAPNGFKPNESEILEKQLNRYKKYDEARQLSRDQLRLQVRDFIEWLKGQGVI